jgi:hypothetical protein
LLATVSGVFAQDAGPAVRDEATVRVHVAAPASVVQRIDLRNEATLERVRLDRAGAGEWTGAVPWTGPTQAIGWGRMEFILGSFEIDEANQDVTLMLPDTKLNVRVLTAADAFPVRITAFWLDAERLRIQPTGIPLGEIEGPDGQLELEGLPFGTYQLHALPADGSLRKRDGNFVAVSRMSLDEASAHVTATLVDDSRWIHVQATDEEHRPLAGVTFFVDSCVLELAANKTDASGRSDLRVVGPGPFKVRAWSDVPDPVMRSESIAVEEPGSNVVSFTMHGVATVCFRLHDRRESGPPPLVVRYVGTGALEGKHWNRDLSVDSDWILPVYLDSGDWLVQVLDGENRVLVEKPLPVVAAACLDVDLDL